jgi:hypothetical protein
MLNLASCAKPGEGATRRLQRLGSSFRRRLLGIGALLHRAFVCECVRARSPSIATATFQRLSVAVARNRGVHRNGFEYFNSCSPVNSPASA